MPHPPLIPLHSHYLLGTFLGNIVAKKSQTQNLMKMQNALSEDAKCIVDKRLHRIPLIPTI